MKNKRRAKVTMVITAVLAIAVAFQGISWNALLGGEPVAAKGFGLVAEASENPGDWVHFYNDDLQDDGDKDNDFNFGPNPWSKSKSAAEYKTEFVERCKWDPALLAAATSWFDVTFGTRFMGDFHKSNEYSWKKAMNEAKEKFAKSQEPYYKTLDYFFDFVEDCDVKVQDCNGVTDQMYMNPYTPNSGMQMPDIIVKKTHDHSGHELVFSRKIKGETFKVAFRIECGFQPTNVAKKMNITPDNPGSKSTTPEKTTRKTTTPDRPNKKTTTPDKGSKSTGPDKDKDKTTTPDKKKDKDKTTTPDKDKENETTPDQGGKDSSKAPDENTEPNDDSGPGKDTNSGGDLSTEDQPSNSNHYDSYDEYREDIDELEDINDTQQTGDDDNSPSIETPADTNVDNNGDKGTGNGGINEETEISPPATEADTGKSIDTATEVIEESK